MKNNLQDLKCGGCGQILNSSKGLGELWKPCMCNKVGSEVAMPQESAPTLFSIPNFNPTLMFKLQKLIDEAPDGTEYVCVGECEGEYDAIYFQKVSGDNCNGLLRVYDSENYWRDAISTLEDLNMTVYDYVFKTA